MSACQEGRAGRVQGRFKKKNHKNIGVVLICSHSKTPPPPTNLWPSVNWYAQWPGQCFIIEGAVKNQTINYSEKEGNHVQLLRNSQQTEFVNLTSSFST